MTYSIDDIFDPSLTHKKPCKVAYAINNAQPVICSMISDQPLFYMDYQDEIDIDEESAEYFDFTAIEEGLDTIESRIRDLQSYGAASIEDETQHLRHEQFMNDMALACGGTEQAAIEDIAFLEKTLRGSRLLATFLDFAAKHGTKLSYDAQISSACYDRDRGIILINPNLARTDRILLAARELRRVWQHRQGALINPMTFHPDQAVLVHRSQMADLAVIMVRAAWELQLSGEKDVWARIENSSMADLGRAFARESYLDFRTLSNGAAQSAVFEAWFLSERCRAEDRRLIQTMLADYRGYVFEQSAMSESVTAEMLIALGSMPFGKNYLAPYVGTIMEDAIFTEVRDRANANFLWFIKFERTFRETEQELQTKPSSKGRDFSSGQNQKENKRFGKNEQKADIIALPSAQRTDKQTKKRKNKRPLSGDRDIPNVISFDFGNGTDMRGR